MRIAIVASPQVPIPPTMYGGTEQVVYYLIKGLRDRGHTPILLGPGDSNVDCEVIATVDRAIGLPRAKKDIPTYLKQLKYINKKTNNLLRSLLPDIDLIHSHWAGGEEQASLEEFASFPNLTTLHGPVTFENLDFFEKNRNLNYVSISHNQQQILPELNYISTVYNGEDPTPFPRVIKPQDYLCFLGRFDSEKNPHLAILLALKLGINIKLAGKIDHLGEDYFREEIEPHLSHPLVEYVGEVNFEQKTELLSNALCNLHPTGFREPFGLTVIEAGFCGTPTLAIARGALPEIIEDKETGLLVEDFTEGYKKIQDCFQMDRTYIADRFRFKFNHDRMTRKYLRAYKRVLKSFQPYQLSLSRLSRRPWLELESGFGAVTPTKRLLTP